MSKKPKVKKSKKNIELTVGDSEPTKYDVMKLIAQKYSIYGSTVWLNTPLQDHENKTPAELLIDGKISVVHDLIEKSNGKFDL